MTLPLVARSTGPTRVVGRPALLRSLRGLAVRVQRFGRHRARTADDVAWAASLLSDLVAVLDRAEGTDGPREASE